MYAVSGPDWLFGVTVVGWYPMKVEKPSLFFQSEADVVRLSIQSLVISVSTTFGMQLLSSSLAGHELILDGNTLYRISVTCCLSLSAVIRCCIFVQYRNALIKQSCKSPSYSVVTVIYMIKDLVYSI